MNELPAAPAPVPVGTDSLLALALPARPYPGMRPFEAAEWPIFFGRESMTDAVIEHLIQGQLVAVHGDSGSGKSSLIRAGVLPRLCQENARGGARWRTCQAMPRGGPLRNLAHELADLDGRAGDAEHVLALRSALNQGSQAPMALAELLLADERDHLCILIDQFEELFEFAREHGQAEACLLADALVAMSRTPPRGLYFVLTLRSEFLGSCARFGGLAVAVNAHQYLLPPMAPADLIRAFRDPAALYGGEVAAPLAERLAADAAEVNGLPLAQHALMLMHRDVGAADAWRLAVENYPADGLAAMLSRHADAVAHEVTARVEAASAGGAVDASAPVYPQRLVEDLFRALTTITAEGHAVRRPQTFGQLCEVTGADAALLAIVVDAFRADGVSFLTPRDGVPLVPGTWVDIGHEALIRSWRALADAGDGWVMKEFRNGLVWRSMLVQADSFFRDPGNVLSETTTDERQIWLRRRNPAWAGRYGGGWDRVQALMAASVEARDKQRVSRVKASENQLRSRLSEQRLKWVIRAAVGAVAVMLGAIFLGGFAWQQRGLAEKRRQEAEEQTSRAIAQTALAEEQTAKLRSSKERNDALLAQKSESLQSLQQGVAELKAARDEPNANLRSAVTQVIGQLTDAADGLQPVTLAPRVYLHIGNEAQRAPANVLRRQLGQLKLNGVQLVVPSVILVAGNRTAPELRCFDNGECRDEAPKLLRQLNGLLGTPQLKLQNLSRRYGSISDIRPHHYEIWFGGNPIEPASSSRPAATGAGPELMTASPTVTVAVAAPFEGAAPSTITAVAASPIAMVTPAAVPSGAASAPTNPWSRRERVDLLAYRLENGQAARRAEDARSHQLVNVNLKWAKQRAEQMNIRTPLGLAVLYDTAIVYDVGVASTMRARSAAAADGRDAEKAWLIAFLERREVVSHDPPPKPPAERARIQELRRLIDKGDWELDGEFASTR